MTAFFLLDFAPLSIALLAAMAAALLGNFMLLRRQTMIADAISHVALPGIVAAFLLTGTVSTWAMMSGATVAALLAVALIALIRRLGRVEEGAAMGVVFTTLFAAGVLLLEQSGASGAHLDVEHALYGNLESLVWFEGRGWSSLVDAAALADLPPQLPRLLVVFAVVAGFVILCWRGLVMATFDAGYAALAGGRPALLNMALVVLVAVTSVAAFEAVGAIIVIAMFICPPAAARLMTDSLARQVWLSLGFAALAAVSGYVLASWGPMWLGWAHGLSAAGMMATMAGVILAVAALGGPRRKPLRQR